MDEINVNVSEETNESPKMEEPQQIVLQEPGKIKKALKWVFGGLAAIAVGIGGFFLLKGKSDNGDEEDSDEGPKDE